MASRLLPLPFLCLLVLGSSCAPAPGGPGDDDDSAGDDDDDSAGDDDDATGDDDDSAGDDDDEAGDRVAGCGVPAAHGPGGVQLELDIGPTGNGVRSFWLSLPPGYDPEREHAIVFGFSGTNWVGRQIQGYLGYEDGLRSDEIYVYPDPQWHDFAGWGNLGGWLLGPHARPADGNQDLVFVEALLDWLEDNYCVDPDRTFASGHSWGGDMAAVTGCWLGDRFEAIAPVAANRPYWFDAPGGDASCVGDAAVWTWFGIADSHFTSQPYAGAYGDEQDAFWRRARGCAETSTPLPWGEEGDCVRADGCSAEVSYCLYGPEAGHGAPSYYSRAVMQWFRSF